MQSFSYRYDLRTAFDDLLTIALSAFSQNPKIGKSHDEDLYLATVGKYRKDEVQNLFPKLLALLINEMEERKESSLGNDVLGEFYEQNLYRRGASQYFTPWPLCAMMASCLADDVLPWVDGKRVLDPSCGSGRTLLAGGRYLGKCHHFYGIDIDHTCVKMAAINLFLNGMFGSEVMWADALDPECFHLSYVISLVPFGVFRIRDRNNSVLWHLHRNSFRRKEPPPKPDLTLMLDGPVDISSGEQLRLF